jgi:hypothetical protein
MFGESLERDYYDTCKDDSWNNHILVLVSVFSADLVALRILHQVLFDNYYSLLYLSKNFHFSLSSRPVLRPSLPPIDWVLVDSSPWVKWPRREAENLPPSSTEVKKSWIY